MLALQHAKLFKKPDKLNNILNRPQFCELLTLLLFEVQNINNPAKMLIRPFG